MPTDNNTNCAKTPIFPCFSAHTHFSTKSTTAFVFSENHRNSRWFGLRSIAPAFLGENKARERVNTVCISRERNEVLVKNAEQDHGLYYSRLVYDNKKPSLSDGFFALRDL